jgi:hypothetical protein
MKYKIGDSLAPSETWKLVAKIPVYGLGWFPIPFKLGVDAEVTLLYVFHIFSGERSLYRYLEILRSNDLRRIDQVRP